MTTHADSYKQRFDNMQHAIDQIAPWLSASLSDPNIECCDRYRRACDEIFELDSMLGDVCNTSFCTGEN